MSLWRETPVLVGRHVTLRPFVEQDSDALVEAIADDLSDLFYTVVPNAVTIHAWMAKLRNERKAGRAMPFAVLDGEGKLAGTTRFMRMSAAHSRVEIGGTLYARRVQRTGLNTEAKRLLLAHAFDELGCSCVQLRTDWLNKRSQRAIERLGAKQDGVLRNHMIMPDGHLRDTVVYSITATEWPGVRANLDHLLARHEGEKR
ncbi:GNAT family N-acetyltransferase [Sphingomonas sp. So64.6b]|uniref:GNAT family N-acetyltransferase n=1 Tax=Sphingomonas sp. So64.6b TaxID=2997354 RepID=UPI001600A24A|nr:GNAT family protein [Sphingomonas sp. So64.6b]QNA83846.1 GNAT family N-acetyltransferase [Sphingomonas sp. So64.6b]